MQTPEAANSEKAWSVAARSAFVSPTALPFRSRYMSGKLRIVGGSGS